MSPKARFLVMLQLLGCLSGCARWDSPSTAVSFDLPTPRMSPDSVVLEIAFLQIPVDSDDEFALLWNEVDEQQLSNEDRRRLHSNGFRVGVIGAGLPGVLRQLLDKAENPFEMAGSSGVLSEDIFQNRRRLPVRSGQPAKIVAFPKVQKKSRSSRMMAVMFVDSNSIEPREFLCCVLSLWGMVVFGFS
jgi:hypothetical protein